jgi:hypothetical protein
MAALAASKGVPYASPYKALCSPTACLRVAEDGAPLQFDYGHLTREGSLLMAKKFADEGLFTRAVAGPR